MALHFRSRTSLIVFFFFHSLRRLLRFVFFVFYSVAPLISDNDRIGNTFGIVEMPFGILFKLGASLSLSASFLPWCIDRVAFSSFSLSLSSRFYYLPLALRPRLWYRRSFRSGTRERRRKEMSLAVSLHG